MEASVFALAGQGGGDISLSDSRPWVLVLDGHVRKAISIVRSLGRTGYRVAVGSPTWLAPAAHSRYASARLYLPPSGDGAKYAVSVLNAVTQHAYAGVIPLEEDSTEALILVRGQIERYTKLAAPPAEAYAIARNKWTTLQAAANLGVPIPRSERPSSLQEAVGVVERFGFPVVMKPVSSSGSRGIRRVANMDALVSEFASFVPRYGLPVMQEAIPWEGQGLGVGCLFQEGQERVSYSYKRLREFPVRGGPSTLRESTNDPEIREYARRLLEAIGWDGVAMVEFKRDPRDGTAKLMEINPRFWGSIELANVAGLNFPALLMAQMRGEAVLQSPYRVGVRCRWLLPGDIAHFLANPERLHMSPSFFRFFDSNTSYDEFAADDVKGNIATVFGALGSIFDVGTWQKGVFRH